MPITDGPVQHPQGDPNIPLLEPLPHLLANPALLNHLEWVAEALGTVYQDIANQMITIYNNCDIKVGHCIDNVITSLAQKYNLQNQEVLALWNDISQDIQGVASTVLSGAQSTLDTCQQDIQTALGNLQGSQLLEVPQQYPDPPKSWPYSFTYDQWISRVTPTYLLRADGSIYDGVRLNPDYTVTIVGGETLDPSISPPNQVLDPNFGWYGSPLGDNSKQDIIHTVLGNCKTPTISQPPPTPIGPPIQSLPIPITGGPIPVPTGSTTPPTPTPTPTEECCDVPCPTPVVNVNVSPTPITVIVQPCQPITSQPATLVPTEGGPVSQPSQPGTGIAPLPVTWEPPVTDLVEQYLDVLGFPKDFVETFGLITEGEIPTFIPEPRDVTALLQEV